MRIRRLKHPSKATSHKPQATTHYPLPTLGGGAASIFRLDTNYGGGKTHALIALTHAARGMPGVQNVDEFIDPDLLPATEVRIAAFDGENADPANGRVLAPMRSRKNMRQVTDGIEAMGREEAAYWLGMAMHRKYPRRVLMALRYLLIDPKA